MYNLYSRDVVLVTRLDEQFKRLQIEEGLYFRHRIAGGSQTSNNPLLPTIASREAHMGYVGLTYATGGIPWLLNSFITFNINADTQAIDHRVGCLLKALDGVAATCPNGNTTGFIDENPSQNRVWETDQYVQLTIPIDKKHGVITGQDLRGALNFYENAPFPYRWTTSQTYLLSKRFNREFSLSLRVRDQWAVPSGSRRTSSRMPNITARSTCSPISRSTPTTCVSETFWRAPVRRLRPSAVPSRASRT